MHLTRTRIGAFAKDPRRSAFAMLFCVVGASLVATGSGRSLISEMAWELKMAHEESGLLRAIEALVTKNPGRWDSKTNEVVSVWEGDGLRISSIFEVPNRKVLEVRDGLVVVFHSDSSLKQANASADSWFLPGKWVGKVIAAFEAEKAPQTSAAPVLKDGLEAALALHLPNPQNQVA